MLGRGLLLACRRPSRCLRRGAPALRADGHPQPGQRVLLPDPRLVAEPHLDSLAAGMRRGDSLKLYAESWRNSSWAGVSDRGWRGRGTSQLSRLRCSRRYIADRLSASPCSSRSRRWASAPRKATIASRSNTGLRRSVQPAAAPRPPEPAGDDRSAAGRAGHRRPPPRGVVPIAGGLPSQADDPRRRLALYTVEQLTSSRR
jgi:hypothetical protein